MKAKKKQPEARKVLDKAAISRILRIVPRQERFHFYRELGIPTGKIAISLSDFVEKMRGVDIRAINFHFKRQDFEKWIREVVGDPELSAKIGKIRRESHGENLRKEIIRIINGRLDKLKTM